ncbi:serine/threonine-protein kinase 16 [Hetaerina americana]|uniref:serine/threonine-protein kinase 16 n=1 Tax=Hetaerina americana TaxID=62018 RepID=UPI003A7F48D1
MNTLGLSLIFKMGCLCAKESVIINSRKYYIKGHLGDGGFSTVELVEDAHTHRTYALKRIICHGPEDQRLALQEVDFHRRFQHPNILECIDAALTGSTVMDATLDSTSQVLILLPYYQRGTLSQELEWRCKNNEPMDSVPLLTMFLQICKGVQAMHEAAPAPLAHRDLKTANILLKEDYTPVIMDLGSMAPGRVKIGGSGEAQTLQDTAGERCSMPYRAPELFTVETHSTIDERTDIWSLGCILYAMCFYKSPFDAVYERGDSVALAVISGNVTFPENSVYSEDIKDLIMFMLNVNPSERPFIQKVIERTEMVLVKLENRV